MADSFCNVPEKLAFFTSLGSACDPTETVKFIILDNASSCFVYETARPATNQLLKTLYLPQNRRFFTVFIRFSSEPYGSSRHTSFFEDTGYIILYIILYYIILYYIILYPISFPSALRFMYFINSNISYLHIYLTTC